MKSQANLVLAGLIIVALALAAAVGMQLQHLRESEMCYRWILAEATQIGMFDEYTSPLDDGQIPKMDKELFTEVAGKLEGHFQDIPEAVDSPGNPKPKLVTVADDEKYDDLLWDYARGRLLAPERAKFLSLQRDKKLSSVESRFDTQAIYSGDAGSVSLGNIFFGFRKVAANFVWLQVDRYWHQGYIQRMVPLMKTCVWLDPTFVDAYLLGAWHLAFNATAKMPDTPEPQKVWNDRYKARVGAKEAYYYMGADFLQDGVRKNPRNYRLYFDLGFGIYNLKLRDYQRAVDSLSKAMRCRHDVWVPRMLYICYEKNKQYAEAIAGWQNYREQNMTNDANREKADGFILRNTGLLKEQKADAAMASAAGEADPAAADAAKAEAEKLREEAKAIWQRMGAVDDPFAVGRLMRMQAKKLMEEQRYLEAIAVLENARWKSPDFFEEACEMIIDAKQKAGIKLSVSEQKAVLRKEEEQKYKQAATAQK